MKLITALTATAALAAGALVAGCGGGDDNETTAAGTDTTGQPITKADFVQQGNQICKEGDAQINQQRTPDPSSPAELDDFVTKTLVPNIQNQIDQIKALGAPAGEEEQVNKFLDDAQVTLDKVKSDPSSVTSDPFAAVEREAEALGLTECAN